MTRAEHLAWVKERALGELDYASPKRALASILSDMTKHEETLGDTEWFRACGRFSATNPDEAQVRAFIEELK